MRNGFTLVELLLVVAIMLLIVGLGSPVYRNLVVSTQLNDRTEQMAQMLRIARSRSVTRLNNSGHGVYFEVNNPGNDRVIMYQGSSYANRDGGYDRELELDAPLVLSTTLAGNEVNFTPGTGDPDNTGVVTLTHEVDGDRSVIINSVGLID